MKTSTFITSNPDIMMGKPTIIGTRLTVDMILEKLAAGQTEQQLLEDYPRLTHEAIQAVLQFAAETVREMKVYSIAS